MIARALSFYMFAYENTGLVIGLIYNEMFKRTITSSKTLGRLTDYVNNLTSPTLLLIKKLVINGEAIAWYVATQNSTLMENHLIRPTNSEARAGSEGAQEERNSRGVFTVL